jgi:hypothetical protein
MTQNDVLLLWAGGNRRSIGRANEIASRVAKAPRLFPQLIAALWSEDPIVRMRAADAIEKITRTNPILLGPHKKELLGLLAEATDKELRWHLAVIVPRLSLRARERQCASSFLQEYLKDRSSIVKTFALQGLTDLSKNDASLKANVQELLRASARTVTAAMKARSRKLLLHLEPR